jgi:hypothetical protein
MASDITRVPRNPHSSVLGTFTPELVNELPAVARAPPGEARWSVGEKFTSSQRAPAAHELGGGVRDLAVDVELALVVGAVADPHRPRATVALQVVERALGQAACAVDVVEHLEVRVGQPRRVQHPLEERVRLVAAAEVEEGLEGDRGVAWPAVAVVPVARAADRLGQRAGGGDHRPGQGVGEELQGQEAADHRVAPRPVVL